MKRYTVENVVDLGDFRFETWLVSPEGVSLKMKEARFGATLQEMFERAEEKCSKLNKMFGSEKHDHKNSPYRTVNKVLVEEKLASKKRYGNKKPDSKAKLEKWGKFISERGL